MGGPVNAFMSLVRAIVAGDVTTASTLIDRSPTLAREGAAEGATRQEAKAYFFDEIAHYLYAGDTALHIAAAAYRTDLARKLVAKGADVTATNRRGATPLHYAVDGAPGSSSWNPRAQAAVVAYLLEAGADPNAPDLGGTTALHRAVRNRCAAAVRVLLDRGADPRRKNQRGSTAMALATRSTGRGGSGTDEAKSQQAEILLLLRRSSEE